MAAIYLDENSGLLMYKKDGKMTPVSTNAVFFPEDCVKFYTSGMYSNQLRFKDMTGTFLPVVATDGNPVKFATLKEVSIKLSREDPSLQTSDKTIVGAINELAVKSGAASLSHTYPVGSELITVYETLTTLPAGTYTITADIVASPDPAPNFQSACLVIGNIEKPCADVESKVKNFGEEFTITKETSIRVAYAWGDHVRADLSVEYPIVVKVERECTITISNIEIMPKSKMAVIARAMPQPTMIGVAQDTDGVYYWTLNGEWLLDDDGNKLPVSGKDGKDGVDGANGADGKDGQDGADGKDGITPLLKIENGYWYISYDNGTTWTESGKATGDNGQDGQNGTDGKDGQDGANGQDGITPLLKIENGYWYISYDNGATWAQLGKATGEDGKDGENGDSFFTSDQAETIKTLLDAYEQDLASKVSVYDYDKTVESLTSQIIQLTEKLTATETLLSQLNSIDLSGLAVAYPKESND